MDQEVYKKMLRFEDEKIDLLERFCMTQGCGGKMRANDMTAKKLSCPQCGRGVCFQCREPWHGYCTTCEDSFKSKVGNQLGAPVIWCPKCKTKIYRDMGCNHMSCSVCSHYFCYVCKGNVGNCLCDAVPIRSRLLRYSAYALMLTIFFAAIPMFMTLAVPLMVVFGCFNLLSGDSFLLCIIPMSICAFNCGCILNAIVLPLGLCLASLVALIYLIYAVILNCYFLCCRRGNSRFGMPLLESLFDDD